MKYYLTTPLYYTNGAPHIGHAYATIAADVIRRFQRLMGRDAVLTTGVDEHGVNVERSARNAGKTPKEFSDAVTREFELNWESIRVQPDRFIRTSSPEHHRTVQWLFERCRQNGFAYKGTYTGQYCPFDNLYVNEAKPGDPCPDCGRPTETVSEDNFFFKLSALQDRLLELYEKHPDFVQPESRRNEVISFVRGGLADLSITRTTIQWGIPVPGEAPHVFYVWFDALIGYLSAAGGPEFEAQGLWPADLHLIGKEILRFHAVFWPAFLMAADLPLPKKVFAHGWLLVEQDKMSKSRGNIVRPRPICEVVGPEPLRYFLLREIVFGQDGSFSYEGMIQRYNADLANGLGNLCSRTLTMLRQYRDGRAPAVAFDKGIADEAFRLAHAARDAYAQFEFSRALESIWTLISAADKFIVERAPWKLAKDPAAQAQLDETLYTAVEVVRIATALASPVIPESAAKIWAQLGLGSLDAVRFPDLAFGGLAEGHQTNPPEAVFPRLEAKPLIEKMRALEEEERKRQLELLGRTDKPAEPAGPPPAPLAPEITIDDFTKVDLRVGLVQEAKKVEGADKLLHLSVDIGEATPRSIVAGIAKAYQPEKLLGRKVVIVANLAPRKLRGLTSQGMIVAASLEGGSPVLAGFLEDVPVGARLK